MVLEIPLSYISNILSRAMNHAVGALGLNIQYGYAGLFTLCFAALSAAGAYATAILVTKFSSDFFVVMPVSIIASVILGFLIALPSLKTRGDYFAIVTLGFSYVVYALLLNSNGEPIRGALGIPSIKRPTILGISFNGFESFAVLSVVVLLIMYFLANKIVNSPYGRILRAMRDNEDAAISLGKDSTKYRLSAFIIGAVFAGVMGSMYAYWSTYIEPKPFGVLDSVYLLFTVLIGGQGNLLGSILGSAILMLLPEPLRFLNLPANLVGGLRQLLLGVIMLLIIIYKPAGLLPEKIRHFTEKHFSEKKGIG